MNKIPLINDLSKQYPNDDVIEIFINKYPDGKGRNVINIYNQLHSKYMSVDDICDYIKFVNYTSLPASEYEYIAPYINKDNFLKIIQKVDIPDVYDELFAYLHHDIVSLYDKFNEYEETWLSRKENFEWAAANDHEILSSYILEKHGCNYYKINGVICDDTFKHVDVSFCRLSLLFKSINGDINIDVFKYVIGDLREHIYANKTVNSDSRKYFEKVFDTIISIIYSKTTDDNIKQYMKEAFGCKEVNIGAILMSLMGMAGGFNIPT